MTEEAPCECECPEGAYCERGSSGANGGTRFSIYNIKTIDAKEIRKIVMIDIPKVFLHADNEG